MPVAGERHIVEIVDFAHDGAGVGRLDGLAVFVPGALPGEEVEIEITAVKRSYAVARLVSVRQAGEARVESRCAAYGHCGGCQLQHLSYARQLEFKRNVVERALARLGKLPGVPVHPVLGMAEPWHYRNKAQLHAGLVEGRLRLGYYQPGSHTLVPLADCPLLPPPFTALVKTLEQVLPEFGVKPYDAKEHKGQLKHLVIKRSHAFGEMMVIFVTVSDRWPGKEQLVQTLQDRCPEVVSWVHNVNPGRKQILGPKFKLIAGQDRIRERLGSLTFLLSPPAFFQVNSQQAAVLYEKAVEYAGLSGRETVFDLYCGTGTLSLFLAQKAAYVYGVEAVPEAIEDAKANASHNGIGNVQFLAGEVERVLPRLAARNIKPDVVVLDPPRQGATPPVLQAIAELSPRSLVYVSCDPATLARDLGQLQEQGYRALEVQPVDMFPQTHHVETVVLLSHQRT